MNTNFYFLEQEWATFYNRATKAEAAVKTDPRASLFYARMALEVGISWMYTNDDELTLPFDKGLNNLMLQTEFKEQFNHKLYNELHLIRKTGNLAVHNSPVSDIDALQVIEILFYFAKWFAKSYSKNDLGDFGVFNWEFIPEKGQSSLSKKEFKELQHQTKKELNKYQKDLEKAQTKQDNLAKENELYKKQIELLQALVNQNKTLANHQDQTQHPRNEYETRKWMIDVDLREAGWNLEGANDKEFKVQYMPKSTNSSETGFVDYVLWNNAGKPLALVEAKKTLESATKGENQAQLYADCLEKMYGQRPVMYYSNGFETFLWDDQFYKSSRLVHGYYTKAELETLFFRRTHRKDIRNASIDTNIAGRTYQMRAIKSITEHFAGTDKRTGKLIGTNRGALLVLATGTGKTRTSIAFSKLMLENNWAKRILFLADRKSLVSQAKSNFVKFLPEHTSVNLLKEKDNPDARLAFSTYQTLMGMIDNNKNGEQRLYGVGHFDLIIVDEAHRSIYKKYQAIFEYFDALFLGLTATPFDRIDRNTYGVFGLADKTPTDAYTFDEAVKNKHLVPYRSIEAPTKFLREGIKYDELSEEEKEEFENEILDGEEATGAEIVSSSELDSWLFNTPTTIETLRYVLKHGIKKRGGEELGKTIIFAKNKKHAQFLKDTFMSLDKELFGNDYVKVITHGEPKAEEMINRFCDEEKERLPQIAISVDMLDTGIDAPSCVNLVFYKPVKSYAKFWQMIGRGSRLRPNLFGQGKDKDKFLIFDLCGNFQFFKENPKGITASAQKSLTETVFGLKLQLAQYLKEKQFEDDAEFKQFRTQLLDELHQEIEQLDTQRFDVKMKLKTVYDFGSQKREVWNHLSKKEIKTITEVLAPLVKPKAGDVDVARFYDKLLYSLMIKRLETPNAEQFVNNLMVPITKVVMVSKRLMTKTGAPQVQQKIEQIKEPLDEVFWKIEGIKHLEQTRTELRDLMKFLDPEDQRYVTTNFMDILNENEVIITDFAAEGDEVYETPFTNNVHRLEEIIRENKDNLTISRIRNGASITPKELASLESLLFTDEELKKGIEKQLGKPLNLVAFIIGLMGLSANSVDSAFAEFINQYQLTAVQIQFIDTLKLFLSKNGKIDPTKLYDAPFKNFHSMGVDGVFNDQQADVLFNIIDGFNENLKA